MPPSDAPASAQAPPAVRVSDPAYARSAAAAQLAQMRATNDPLTHLLQPEPQALVCDSSTMAAAPMPTLPRMGGGGCPIDHTQFKSPAAAAAAAHAAHSGSGGVSVVGDQFPDATRSPTQRLPLSTAPVASRIPRGGEAPPGQPPLGPDATWIFPSPQRFYNAMQKKGWDPHEPDMAWVVGIHNSVNEQAWSRVMAFESLHASSCPTPKLLRFRGRPGDLSPRARVRGWFGSVAPFDRHDWVVDRCGREVRYVIDFYQGPTAFLPPAGAAGGAAPAPGPLAGMPPSIHLDVRPALSFGGLMDQARLAWKDFTRPPAKRQQGQ